jgi:two-component system vancomycin resistance associated response regulator VraR
MVTDLFLLQVVRKLVLFEMRKMVMALRIVLYDAYKLALLGMEDMIKTIHDFEVLGAFSEKKELTKCLEENKADVVVVDLMLKSSQGLGLIDSIKKIQKDVKIIVMLESQDELVIKRVIEMGVNAILRKDTSYSELVSSIISVAKGNDIFPDAAMGSVKSSLLSDMEQKVLENIADEKTNDEIAKNLYISRRTVETYVSNICEKLGSINRVGAVRKAMKLGIIK